MNSPSRAPAQYDEPVPQLPVFSQDFQLELGVSTNNPREQLGERQMHSDTPPIKENIYSRVKSVHGVIEHHQAPAMPMPSNGREEPIREEAEQEEDISTQREAMSSLDWIEEVIVDFLR